MQLDHIDGNSHNHKLENLRMTCPNCHSQTHNYGYRGYGNSEGTPSEKGQELDAEATL
jgi:5-methylcytosine-specific restriction endonuclease McrA